MRNPHRCQEVVAFFFRILHTIDVDTANLIRYAMAATGSRTRGDLAELIQTPYRTLAGWSCGESTPPAAAVLLLRLIADRAISREQLEAAR